jgi:predicted metal-dependent enzyme (double-stranded beta helix superfamily)
MADLMKAFIAQCRELRGQFDWPERIAEVLRSLIGNDAFAKELLGDLDPELPGERRLYLQSPDLTIFTIRSHGGGCGPPHDHRTAAVIGLVTGVEQFKIYSADGDRIREVGLERVVAPEVEVLRDCVIHAMWNNKEEGGLSIHIYGNTFFDVPGRRIWDPYTFACEAYDDGKNYQWCKELTIAARGAS